MLEQQHPVSGSSKYLLKRWRRHTIYSKSGSYVRTENPMENLYQTNSIYLYDYVVTTDKFFYDSVYTASTYDGTPSVDADFNGTPIGPNTNTWNHYPNTWKNSPNAVTNDYVWRYNPSASLRPPIHSRYGYSSLYTPPLGSEWYTALMKQPIIRDDGTFFEIVRGYPRNHYTHKRHLFSLFTTRTFGIVNRTITSGSYVRNRQTTTSTVGQDGLEDGSAPVQSVQVGNLKLVQTDNVINH